MDDSPWMSSRFSAAYAHACSNGTALNAGFCRHKSSFPPTK